MERNTETNRENDVPMIELHKVDTVMAYAARIVRDVKIIVAICIAAIFLISVSIVMIFTTKYNERTSDWLKTYNLLKTGQTEVADESAEKIQQLPAP